MLYKVQYRLKESQNSSPETHCRYYRALTAETALDMFNGTCEETLHGYDPEPIAVFKKATSQSRWEPIKRFQ